jgi:hypothetical protein
MKITIIVEREPGDQPPSNESGMNGMSGSIHIVNEAHRIIRMDEAGMVIVKRRRRAATEVAELATKLAQLAREELDAQ